MNMPALLWCTQLAAGTGFYWHFHRAGLFL